MRCALGALLDRNGTKTAVPVTVAARALGVSPSLVHKLCSQNPVVSTRDEPAEMATV